MYSSTINKGLYIFFSPVEILEPNSCSWGQSCSFVQPVKAAPLLVCISITTPPSHILQDIDNSGDTGVDLSPWAPHLPLHGPSRDPSALRTLQWQGLPLVFQASGTLPCTHQAPMLTGQHFMPYQFFFNIWKYHLCSQGEKVSHRKCALKRKTQLQEVVRWCWEKKQRICLLQLKSVFCSYLGPVISWWVVLGKNVTTKEHQVPHL